MIVLKTVSHVVVNVPPGSFVAFIILFIAHAVCMSMKILWHVNYFESISLLYCQPLGYQWGNRHLNYKNIIFYHYTFSYNYVTKLPIQKFSLSQKKVYICRELLDEHRALGVSFLNISLCL